LFITTCIEKQCTPQIFYKSKKYMYHSAATANIFKAEIMFI